MSQPPKSTILAPCWTWVPYRGVLRPIATSLRMNTETQAPSCFAPLSLRPERLRAQDRALLPFGGSLDATALQRSRESAVHVPERFRAVAPSAALVKGLSPDSSYRGWGGMIQKSLWVLKRNVLIYLARQPPVAREAPVARRPPMAR